MEAYYEESRRAGHDNKLSCCILYYNFKDKRRIEHLSMKGKKDNTEVFQYQIRQMYDVIAYCEDEIECKRVLQLKVIKY